MVDELTTTLALEPRFRVGRVAALIGAAPGTVRDWLRRGDVVMTDREFLPAQRQGQMRLINSVGVLRIVGVHCLSMAGLPISASAAGADKLAMAVLTVPEKGLREAPISAILSLMESSIFVVDHIGDPGNAKLVSSIDWFSKMPLNITSVIRIGRIARQVFPVLMTDEESRVIWEIEKSKVRFPQEIRAFA